MFCATLPMRPQPLSSKPNSIRKARAVEAGFFIERNLIYLAYYFRMSATENSETETSPRDEESERLRKGISYLLTRKIPYESLIIHSTEGLKLMHLRYEADPKYAHRIWLKFKRAPEMKPYYAAIRDWATQNNLEWNDKTYNKERYISVSLEPYLDKIEQYVHAANDTIFKSKSLRVSSNDPNLSLALSGIHHPYLMMISVVMMLVGIFCLPLYEIFRLPYLGKPSFLAIDWPEGFLILSALIGGFALRYFIKKGKKKEKEKQSKLKLYLGRTVLLMIVALAFFTY